MTARGPYYVDKDAWVAQLVGGTTYYGNGEGTQIMFGAVPNADATKPAFKSRGIFEISAADVAAFLLSATSVDSATITLTAGTTSCIGSFPAETYAFLEELNNDFVEKAVSGCNLGSGSGTGTSGVWNASNTATTTNRATFSGSGIGSDDPITFDVTAIFEARRVAGNTGVFRFRVIAAKADFSGYDETNGSRRMSVYSREFATVGSRPNLTGAITIGTVSNALAETGTSTEGFSVSQSGTSPVLAENATATDSFTAAPVGGWLTAIDDTGNGRGLLTLPAANTTARAYLNGVSTLNAAMRCKFRFDKLAAGGSSRFMLMNRFSRDPEVYYQAKAVANAQSQSLDLLIDLCSVAAATDPVPRMTIFFQWNSATTLSEVQAAATEFQYMNVTGAIMRSIDAPPPGSIVLPSGFTPAWLDEFTSRGIRPYVGAWVSELNVDERDAVISVFASGGGNWAGLFLDAEANWETFSTGDEVAKRANFDQFFAGVRPLTDTIMWNTYQTPNNQEPGFHHSWWNEQCDYVMPHVAVSTVADINQAYQRVANAAVSWSQPAKPIWPLINIYHADSADDVQIRADMMDVAFSRSGVVAFWRWYENGTGAGASYVGYPTTGDFSTLMHAYLHTVAPSVATGTTGVVTLQAVSGIRAFVPNVDYWLQMQCEGTNPTVISAKVWRVGEVEPNWQLIVSDATSGLQDAGAVGMAGGVSSTVTALPLTMLVEQFEVFAAE